MQNKSLTLLIISIISFVILSVIGLILFFANKTGDSVLPETISPAKISTCTPYSEIGSILKVWELKTCDSLSDEVKRQKCQADINTGFSSAVVLREESKDSLSEQISQISLGYCSCLSTEEGRKQCQTNISDSFFYEKASKDSDASFCEQIYSASMKSDCLITVKSKLDFIRKNYNSL